MLNYHKTQADKKRHELGLSYADVAALTGLSKPTVRAAMDDRKIMRVMRDNATREWLRR